MPILIKKKTFDLLQQAHDNYNEMVAFFMDGDISNVEKERKAVELLNKEFEKVQIDSVDLPSELDQIKTWFRQDHEKTCQVYQAYLARRKAGQEREYFKNIGQAFEFLIKVSPIKQVDGSWLYSLVNYWNDPVFHDLILIYLEELGLGSARANHVCIYSDLLRVLGLDDFEIFLEDEYYQHAAIQLAFGYAPAEFIPEIIGFNLGYEQLPLHLLISNYELKELGIDSKYFNLHITIDNLDNGHAYKSIKALEKIDAKYKNKENFIKKLKRGYALNQHGITSMQIIQNLDLEKFVNKILKRKAITGHLIHNEKCQIAGLSINQWLSTPDKIERFVQHLIERKWIKLNTDPEESPFWRLIHHEDGKMYGVFNPTEKQVIYDWIAGEHDSTRALPCRQMMNHAAPMHEYLFSYISDDELDQLQLKISQTPDIVEQLGKLIPFLAPDSHHKSIGLWSTQKYVELLFPYLTSPQNYKSP